MGLFVSKALAEVVKQVTADFAEEAKKLGKFCWFWFVISLYCLNCIQKLTAFNSLHILIATSIAPLAHGLQFTISFRDSLTSCNKKG